MLYYKKCFSSELSIQLYICFSLELSKLFFFGAVNSTVKLNLSVQLWNCFPLEWNCQFTVKLFSLEYKIWNYVSFPCKIGIVNLLLIVFLWNCQFSLKFFLWNCQLFVKLFSLELSIPIKNNFGINLSV